ncbi:MAG TPA: sigma-54 dependent transcriptional regulator [Blastocatellia bacterium]|nr:sigma-54 dependent transcriptional regulator [Blastocatellia bacterium]
MKGRILVVDDEISIAGALEAIFTDEDYAVTIAHNATECQDKLNHGSYDLVLTDLRLPDGSGIDILHWVKAAAPETEVILMTAHGSIDITIQSIKEGAYYYIEKPFRPDHVVTLAERALERAAIRNANRTLKQALDRQGQAFGMIGNSPKMRIIYETIRSTAESDASVLIEGESGTGKELIATALHTSSRRSGKSLIHINCAAIPNELLESELFGYRKGAFTGADRDKRGLIEAASGGTLLLDEITEMPQHLQAKLLRVLQERKVRRLGEEREIEIDFRLISATNRNAQNAIQEGLLREDLYFRIGTIKIRVPPLRERLDDLALLADRFLKKYSGKYNRKIEGISQTALEMLCRYTWPGNVRELESVIECAVLFCQARQLRPEDLRDNSQFSDTSRAKCQFPPFLTLEEIEREAILQTLGRTGGNIRRAAQILAIHRPTFYRKLRKFGIQAARIQDFGPGREPPL